MSVSKRAKKASQSVLDDLEYDDDDEPDFELDDLDDDLDDLDDDLDDLDDFEF